MGEEPAPRCGWDTSLREPREGRDQADSERARSLRARSASGETRALVDALRNRAEEDRRARGFGEHWFAGPVFAKEVCAARRSSLGSVSGGGRRVYIDGGGWGVLFWGWLVRG